MMRYNMNKKLKLNLLGELNRVNFALIMALVIAIIIVGVCIPDALAAKASALVSMIVDYAGWWLVICIISFFLFALILAFSRFGKIKLGKDDEKPEYSFFSWFSMLFGCGMGVAFYFWGVGEPLSHFMNTPYLAESGTVEAASVALQITNMHYGITMWSAYAVIGLAIAYFAFRKDKPLTVSSGLYGLLGERAYGPIGKVIDFLTVFATIGGVATSVGLGVM